MGTIKTRRYVFRQRPRPLRTLALAVLVASAALGVTAISRGDAGDAPQDRDEILPRLTAPSGPLDADRVDFHEPRVYAAIGGEERCTLEMAPKGGLIRFHCATAGEACPPGAEQGGAGPVIALRAVTGAEGEPVLIAPDGDPVLRIAITGGMTLLHGSRNLPASVPETGRAMLKDKAAAQKLSGAATGR
jgi:hypothetical protein